MSDVTRQIPGIIQVQGREFFYIEIRSGEQFNDLIDLIFASCPAVPPPGHGGVIGEKSWITLRDGTMLFGISYKGDLDGWRKKIQVFCKESGRRLASPSNVGLIFPDGSFAPFSDCKIVLEN